ncbi:MAG: DNA mismatch endonuclease Vsr [Sphaerochaetaceae bacterium]|jgi:DNA mismatch endonuclease (patch repair protein)|nr:DNA mismatch endonuclease Vsr [Sphaerochaetaceae bacterium]
MDTFEKAVRSRIMSHIRGKDTKPEMLVRRYLFSRGFRYRVNDKRYPGHPDIVLPRYRTVIFVNGCFWHSHEGCKLASRPSSNTDYWDAKLKRNKENDAKAARSLEDLGFNVIVIWECQLSKSSFQQAMDDLETRIKSPKE